jgi:hypothetical protein
VAVDLDAANLEDVAEGGRVDDVDFQEQDVGGAGDGVHALLLVLLGAVLGGVAGLALVGDDVEGGVVAEGVGDESAGSVVELDLVGA